MPRVSLALNSGRLILALGLRFPPNPTRDPDTIAKMAEATVVYYMNRPKGDIQDDTFEVRKEPMPVPKDGELLVACEYLSLDPASRTWMEEGD